MAPVVAASLVLAGRLTPRQIQHALGCLIGFPPKIPSHPPHVDIFSVIFNSRGLVSPGQDHTTPHATFACSRVRTGRDLPTSPLDPQPARHALPWRLSPSRCCRRQSRRAAAMRVLELSAWALNPAPTRCPVRETGVTLKIKGGRWRKLFQQCFPRRAHSVNEQVKGPSQLRGNFAGSVATGCSLNRLSPKRHLGAHSFLPLPSCGETGCVYMCIEWVS